MPERRGWTPNELRRLKETDPEAYERVARELGAQLGIDDWVRTLNEAVRATIRIAPAPEPVELEPPDVLRARLEAEQRAHELELLEEIRDALPPVDPPTPDFEAVEAEVAKRIAAGRPFRGELTQRRIAQRFGISRRQVQRIEARLRPD